MHFVIDEQDYFDFEIGVQTTYLTPMNFRDYRNVIEIEFDYNLAEYGWGCGSSWYISRKDIKAMADGLRELCDGERDVFEHSCKQVKKICGSGEYYYLQINKTNRNIFHAEFRIMTDLEIVELKADFTQESLRKDAQLWQEYAETYPVIETNMIQSIVDFVKRSIETVKFINKKKSSY